MRIHASLSGTLIKPLLAPHVLENTSAIFLDANIPSSTIQWLGEIAAGKKLFATSVSPAKANRLLSVLPRLDTLFTNVAEAAALFGLSANSVEASDLARLLADSPCRRGTLSNGENPLWYWEDSKVMQIRVPVIDRIKDVTGAGDALAAGTIAALLCGTRFDEAVSKGIEMAQKVLRVDGPYLG
jgi:sugar/nucleoside kinase (ribokinase family)